MKRLHNSIRDYSWGSTTEMARFFHWQPTGQPQAELWMGAHPDSPSLLENDEPLNNYIDKHPQQTLGPEVSKQYGNLPFLMKVLAVAGPLSLQVHPSKAQAELGYAEEEKAGVPRNSSSRNYKDDNHKPEMLYALTPFTALCGFRPVNDAAQLAKQLSKARGLQPNQLLDQWLSLLIKNQTKAAFTLLVKKPEGLAAAVAVAVQAITTDQSLANDSAFRLVLDLQNQYPDDPGVLLSLMLNHVALNPGESIYAPAGNIHAYLSGLCIEIMASSDNVLRGGLTPKHIDVPELLKLLDWEPMPQPTLQTSNDAFGQIIPPSHEFMLHTAHPQVGEQHEYQLGGPGIVLCLAGVIELNNAAGQRLKLELGQSAFIEYSDAELTITCDDEARWVIGAAQTSMIAGR